MLKFKVFSAVTLMAILSSCSTNKVPTQEEQTKTKTAKINAQLGIAYLEQNNIQRAKQKLLLALDQAPNIPETWYSMAYFFEATGNADEAKQYYLKAIEVAPKRGDAHNNYGTFLCRNGEYKTSVHHFLVAVQDRAYLDPADAYENAGICAAKIPDNERAAFYFQQALSEDPSRPVSSIKLAELEYKSGNYKNAEIHLNQFLSSSTPTEQSIRLSKLLVLKSHSDAPAAQPVEVAAKAAAPEPQKTPITLTEVKKPAAKKAITIAHVRLKKPLKVVMRASKPKVMSHLKKSTIKKIAHKKPAKSIHALALKKSKHKKQLA